MQKNTLIAQLQFQLENAREKADKLSEEADSLHRQISQWKRLAIEVGHALRTENVEQFEFPEIAKAALLRQIRWNEESRRR